MNYVKIIIQTDYATCHKSGKTFREIEMVMSSQDSWALLCCSKFILMQIRNEIIMVFQLTLIREPEQKQHWVDLDFY